MAKMPRDDDGLSPQEGRAAVLRAQGLTQADAYRQAFGVRRAKQKSVIERASRLFAKDNMKSRVRELLRAAKVEDIDSVGQAFDDLLRLLAKAETDGNWTAAANLMRQRLQAHGILRDRVAFTLEQQASDDDLLERLAGDDPAKLAALRTILGAPNTFDTQH